MSTHDYVIANQTGANTRSDLNTAFSAIVSNNSSATEPTTTYAYQWWADTGNDLLKQRNAADSAWISILTLSTGAVSNAAIADDAVTLAKMAAGTDGELITYDTSGDPTTVPTGSSGEVLTSNGAGTTPTFQAAAGGGGAVLKVVNATYTGSTSINTGSWTAVNSNLDVVITPTASDSSFYIEGTIWVGLGNHDTGYVFNISDSQVGSTTGIFSNKADNGSAVGGYAAIHSSPSEGNYDDYLLEPIPISGFYTPASNNGSVRTFTLIARGVSSSARSTLHINIQGPVNPSADRAVLACSNLTVWEIANGIF